MTKNKTTDEQKQKMYLEFQMLTQQRDQMQNQMQTFDKQLIELEEVKENLREVEKIKKGTEIYVPVSGGIFAKATIEDSKNLLVNVGSNTIVSKDVEKTIRMIDEQITGIGNLKVQFMEQIGVNSVRLKMLQQKLLEIVENEG